MAMAVEGDVLTPCGNRLREAAPSSYGAVAGSLVG